MNWLDEISGDLALYDKLQSFLGCYGLSGLEEALCTYTDMHREYICKTKSSVSRIKIDSIFYLKIQGHHISVHTTQGICMKYGTLSNEMKLLGKYEFVKCSQSCIISLTKIRNIRNDQIFLINNEVLHMSRSFAPKVLTAFHHVRK